jgi:hypothetical protein
MTFGNLYSEEGKMKLPAVSSRGIYIVYQFYRF